MAQAKGTRQGKEIKKGEGKGSLWRGREEKEIAQRKSA